MTTRLIDWRKNYKAIGVPWFKKLGTGLVNSHELRILVVFMR